MSLAHAAAALSVGALIGWTLGAAVAYYWFLHTEKTEVLWLNG